jgi:hypothetical protein
MTRVTFDAKGHFSIMKHAAKRREGAKPRYAALRKVRTQFIERGYPRLVAMTLLAGAGITAFGSSVLLLGLGLDHMGLRYALATAVGYVAFLLLIRVWIAMNRTMEHLQISDVLSIPDLPTGAGVTPTTNAGFSGGGSGGGGASHSWGAPSMEMPDLDVGVDADEAWPVVVAAIIALVRALGAVFALYYVVYTAPILLAEVALDAALVAGVYRNLRKEDAGYWLTSAIRHTWKPAAAVAICLSIAGTVLQWAIPSALSIGEVFRQFE